MTERKELYRGDYFFFFDDGTLGVSDGVGYVGSLEKEEVKALYLCLKMFFENPENKD